MPQERAGVVTMEGEPLTLLGPELGVGDAAPDFTAVDRDFSEVSLGDFAGQVVLISAVASVDTGVCAEQTRRFNEELAALPDGVAVLTISQDLPFALDRFCGAEGLDRIQVLSDHVEADFGLSYGVLIKGMRLLARSIFVVDAEGRLAHVEIVPELTDHPDYEAALGAVRQLTEAE
jgi:thiol peroxidase